MGWWCKDIMGGDDPLDVELEIYHICGVQQFTFDEESEMNTENELTNEDLVNNMESILEFVRSQQNDDDQIAIGFQVLGVMLMKVGAPISQELKGEILENSKKDSWAAVDKERARIIENFHSAIESYNGTQRVIIRSKGLTEAFEKFIASGKPGCINV
jgi:hypothetical protein